MVDLCTLSGTLRDSAGVPFRNATVTLRPVPGDIRVTSGGMIVLPVVPEPEVSDAAGLIALTRAPGKYAGSVRDETGRVSPIEVSFPDLASAPLEDYVGKVDVVIQTSAQLARDLAQRYAQSPVDTPVAGGDGFSALHHAAKAAQDRVLTGQDAAATALAASQAQAALVLTEAAWDAAGLGAGAFLNTGAGLAATSVGGQFRVIAGAELVLYDHEAGGVAVEVPGGRTFTTAGVQTEIAARVDDQGIADDVALAFGDPGLPAAWFDHDGSLHARLVDPTGAPTLSDRFAEVTVGSGDVVAQAIGWDGSRYDPARPAMQPHLSDEFREVHVDADGNVQYGLRWNGTEYRAPVGDPTIDYQWVEVGPGGLVKFAQRQDGTFIIGPRPLIDWRAVIRSGDVWLVAQGRAFRVTFDGSGGVYQYLDARAEGLLLEIWRLTVATGAVDVISYPMTGTIAAPAGVTMIEHLPGAGQSNLVGISAGTRVTTVNPDPRILMFPQGPRVFGTQHGQFEQHIRLQPFHLADMVPGVEITFSSVGETGMVQQALEYLPAIEATTAVAVSAHGHGSTPYSGSAPGSQPFLNLVFAMRWSRWMAGLNGYGWRWRYATYDGNEGNVLDNAAHRVAAMVELQAAYTAEMRAMTGSLDGQVAIVYAQMSSSASYGLSYLSGMPEGQLLAAETYPAILNCSGPCYDVTYSDTAHRTSAGHAKVGRLRGYFMGRHLAGLDPTPLRPLTAVNVANVITVSFHVPSGSVWEINTALVSDPGNWGVTIHAANKALASGVTITGVTNLGAGVIEVAYTGTLPVGALLGVAVAGTANAMPGPITGMRSNFAARVTGETHYDGSDLILWSCHKAVPIT